MEFIGFGHRRTGHAGNFAVKAEEVLQGDGGVGLGFFLNAHAFFGFNCLVQAIRPAAAGQDAAGEFIDDAHFVTGDEVFLIAGKEMVRRRALSMKCGRCMCSGS